MSPLRIEVYKTDTDSWIHVGDIDEGDPDASLSANNPDGSRDVYLFGVDVGNREGFIKRSIAGVDIAGSETRVVNSAGFDIVATLGPGQSYEVETVPDRSQGETRRIRFTYFAD